MSQLVVDRDAFFRHVRHFYHSWNNNEENLENIHKVDAIVVIVGQNEGVVYSESTALQTWLFGYEMTDIMIVLCHQSIHVLASKKNVEFLKLIESSKENGEGVPPITLLVRDKTDKDGANFERLTAAIEKSKKGKVIGEFLKDKFTGDFVDEWKKVFNSKNYENVDISSAAAYIMAPKDQEEIKLITNTEGTAANVLTQSEKKLKNIAIIIKDEESEEEDKKSDIITEDLGTRGSQRTALMDTKLRNESTEEKRKVHQKELAENLNEAARARLPSKAREAEECEKEGIVKQDSLVLSQNKANPKLKDLYIRPNIMTEPIHGTLEAHSNGFRFTSIRDDRVDILYNNIKHAFIQPCDGEMIILLHFTLKNAIMFGKTKESDIQFYTQVGEITTDLGKPQHLHDLAAEQVECELRQKLKTGFKTFCDKVEQMTKQEIEFDTPSRDLGFPGVSNRSIVLLQPTSGCLVNLTDWPPFVITVEEVEQVHFERVQLHLDNFDMIFVFKDYNRKISMVSAVPINMLDRVEEWLDSCDIRYTKGIQSLNWPKIMKTIADDPEDFFDCGGWSFLDHDIDEENNH